MLRTDKEQERNYVQTEKQSTRAIFFGNRFLIYLLGLGRDEVRQPFQYEARSKEGAVSFRVVCSIPDRQAAHGARVFHNGSQYPGSAHASVSCQKPNHFVDIFWSTRMKLMLRVIIF